VLASETTSGLIAPGAVISDIHALLADAAAGSQRAVGID